MLQATEIADLILKGFRRHFSLFQKITALAQQSYAQKNWLELQRISSERISYYDLRVSETLALLQQKLTGTELNDCLWQQVKQQYQQYLLFHPQAELAETFYNSVFCRLYERKYFHNQNIFVESTLSKQRLPAPIASVYESYFPAQYGLKQSIRAIVASFHLQAPFVDLERDIRLLVRTFIGQSSHGHFPVHLVRFDILKSLFFRNKAAYIVGRVVTPDGQQPFIIPLLHEEDQGIYVDTLITDPQQMTIIFGFSRAYFMVEMTVPSALVHFLKELLPHKTLAELYSSIGLHKQGKTEFYRELLTHLDKSSDQFVAAPGIRGMVMMVFTLPSFPYVFKVIRDKFAPTKEFGRDTVKARYLLVKKHDRVGRMADTMEYSDVALPLSRFSPELLEELQQSIAGSMQIEDDRVIIKHLYIERRMLPLNLYLEQASYEQKAKMMADYGQALKDMIAANIFPGDMLLKNFGVTRHGRVIFYDYDEVQYLLDVNFRTIPKTDNYDDMLSNEPWYSVGPGDVFPEQITTYVTAQNDIRQMLIQSHPELMDASYWQEKQQRIRDGIVEDVFPYPQSQRFKALYEAEYAKD
ncbi:bifunctional isocitrate dehydrogenase kinase/phosphatase [Rheinheimera sp. 1928-s]|uniref:bifunctional isocitrate dehydrogenase kinase/phosphatase n=1 Tax=Rheinheimera sp. 1928-s TaxID=3033803 RepID=UPI00260F3697|nr:bifunctional isocitrate dehydrogenase kinase/phosphatase [Rheinheimera sp. 1928-s]MDF3124238.1 bifunctional isocitrate dehydrogenase kinase/phosphatase [Rheinheimera sp. 1928-s]